ncbi:uncharacterized protein LOC117645801 [Thrips palmi]|uniref:Uncharacterized protein LOC117645801 n=1 Tax=Thrips palmi TaxID=161013 RepID=A0A6P8Z626_THRPL|nr:uncharacterized protein LOC117645801 [Thrips palmi]
MTKMLEETEAFLPPEILSMIFEYLPASDIANCSLVCLRWREEINRNELWRRLCLQRGWAEVLDQPEVWSQTTSRVEPNFKAPEQKEGSRLVPLCSWHVDFLQCAHLYKNWRQGCYAIQNFDEIVSEQLGHVLITSMDLNRMFVVLGDDTGGVTIWKQAKEKPEFVEYVSCLFSNAVISEIFLEGTSFAVLQLGLLQVYHKSDSGNYTLCYTKAMIVEAPDLPPLSLGETDKALDDWFVENIYENFEEDEFRYARACQDPVVAFWGTIKSVEVLSLKPGGNLKTLKLPFENYKISDVALGSHASLIYVALESKVLGNVILEYSLEKDLCVKQLQDTSTIMRIHLNCNFLVSVNKQGIFTIWDCLKGGKHCVLPPLGLTFQDTSLGLFGDSILYQSGNTIGSVLNSTGKIQFNKFEVEPSTKFLTKGMGDLFILRNGEDVEVWSWLDKTLKYCIQGILRKDDRYAAWCNDACIVLWGFYTPPILIWFW